MLVNKATIVPICASVRNCMELNLACLLEQIIPITMGAIGRCRALELSYGGCSSEVSSC